MYNPLEFWTKNGILGITYDSELHHQQEQVLLETLKTLKFKTVLEVGCGYGRITNLIQRNFKVEEYVGIDISLDQLMKAVTTNHFTDILQADITKPSTIPDWLKEKTFDLVIAVEVLMHIKPEDIENAFQTMLSLSSKYILNLDYYTEEKEELADYNFMHDYPSLYKDKESQKIKLGKQCIFYCLR